MPMTRQDRVNAQKKQDKIIVMDGVPVAADLQEGVPTLRKTKEGLVEYVKHENILYKTVMKLADKADVAAAAVSTTTITIDPSDGIISQDTSSDGYAKFGAGLIIQWGTTDDLGTAGVVTIDFTTNGNIDFSNNCFTVVANSKAETAIGSSGYNIAIQTYGYSTTGFTARVLDGAGGSHGNRNDGFTWIAIGN